MVENEEAALRAEIARLNKMVVALMNRAERAMSAQGSDFGLFQSTVILERQVQERTKALEAALQENEKINRAMQRAKEQLSKRRMRSASSSASLKNPTSSCCNPKSWHRSVNWRQVLPTR